VCIDAALPIPGPHNQFEGVASAADGVRRFLEAARGEPAMVIQAGVWALTDGYTAEQIRTRLAIRNPQGIYRLSISDEDILRAKRILDALGIRNNL
jgi:hypothetical protein